MTRATRKLWLLVVVLGAAACVRNVPPPDLSRDPAALLAQVRAAQARVVSVRGEARVRVDGHAFSGALRQFVAAARPDRVHVETLDFFGNPVAILAVAQGRLALYDAREKVLYRGAATPENLARLVPLPLSPEALVAILCGSAPLLAGGAPVDVRPGKGFLSLDLADGPRTQSLRVGPGAAVVRSELRVGGAAVSGTYDLAFGAFETIANAPFPIEVTLSAESPHVKLKLAWKDVELNGALEPDLFRIEQPRGARVVELDDAAPPEGGGLFQGAGPGE